MYRKELAVGAPGNFCSPKRSRKPEAENLTDSWKHSINQCHTIRGGGTDQPEMQQEGVRQCC